MMTTILSKIPHTTFYLIAGVTILLGFYTFFGIGLSHEQGHLWVELGSAFIFTGLIALWCAHDFSRGQQVRYALMIFFTFMAIIHWIEYFRGAAPLESPLINTLPVFGLVLSEWILTRKTT